jgi:hypothetical protein
MVNAGVVNAKSVCLNRVVSCAFLLESRRFLHFKKPVKYIHNFHVNHGRDLFTPYQSYIYT